MNKTTKNPTIDYDSNPFTLSFRGLGLLIEYAKGVFIALLVFGMLGLFSNIISYIPSGNTSNTTTNSASSNSVSVNTESSTNNGVEWGVVGAFSMVVISIIIMMFFVVTFLSSVYKGFVSAGAVSASEKRMITFGEAFSEMGNRLGVLFKAEVITSLKIIGGYILLIVPGVRAQLRYQSTSFIIMKNKDISASDAINLSKDLYKNHLMESFGIITVGGIIPFIGSAVSASGMAMSVQQLMFYKESNLETPKTHWLNYIGLVFIALIFILVFSTIALAIALLGN